MSMKSRRNVRKQIRRARRQGFDVQISAHAIPGAHTVLAYSPGGIAGVVNVPLDVRGLGMGVRWAVQRARKNEEKINELIDDQSDRVDRAVLFDEPPNLYPFRPPEAVLNYDGVDLDLLEKVLAEEIPASAALHMPSDIDPELPRPGELEIMSWYQEAVSGVSWKTLGEREKQNPSTLRSRVERYAKRQGMPWPPEAQ